MKRKDFEFKLTEPVKGKSSKSFKAKTKYHPEGGKPVCLAISVNNATNRLGWEEILFRSLKRQGDFVEYKASGNYDEELIDPLYTVRCKLIDKDKYDSLAVYEKEQTEPVESKAESKPKETINNEEEITVDAEKKETIAVEND